MKKFNSILLLVFICTTLFIQNFTVFGVGEQEEIKTQSVNLEMADQIKSEAYYLVDNKTGTVIDEKNKDLKMYPAGITKIVTAIIAIENANLNDMVTFSENAAESFKSAPSFCNFKTGEQVSVQNLLYALLLAPSNEAAVAIAEHISGTEDEFVVKMNELAKKVNALNTNFTNSHGMHDDNHYTTAYDIYLISRYALSNPKFKEISSGTNVKLPPNDVYQKERSFFTDNALVTRYKYLEYYYKSAKGVMVGYTSQGGYSIVSTASKSKDGMELLCIIMGGKKENSTDPIPTYVDANNLFESAFQKYTIKVGAKKQAVLHETKVIAGKMKDYLTLGIQNDVNIVLPISVKEDDIIKTFKLNKKIVAPIESGEVLGSVEISYGEKSYGVYPMVALFDVERNYFLYTLYLISLFFANKYVKLALLILFLFIIFYIYLLVIASRRRKEIIMRAKRAKLENKNKGTRMK